MLSLPQRKQLEANIPKADILLFSGGGNDIAGDQFCIWLNDNKDNDPINAVDWERLGAALDLTMATYNDLALIRDTVNPNCWIVTHGYDFPPITGKGIFWLGPWLKPSLDYCGWTDSSHQYQIVRAVLSEFNRRLANWGAEKHIHVPTQGTLSFDDWGNEIHPNRIGFDKIAAKFSAAISPIL